MSEFQDQYVEQMLKGMAELGKRLFPDEVTEAFRIEAEADIAAGRNRCLRTGEPTMLRWYPTGAWICEGDADALWKTGGYPMGHMIFDMTKP